MKIKLFTSIIKIFIMVVFGFLNAFLWSLMPGSTDLAQAVSFVPASLLSVDAPTDVWVDDDYNSGTPGWGVTHFDNLQNGIDAVEENGTVHVLAGTYVENITIQKGLSLLGAGHTTTTIDGQNSGYPIIIEAANSVTVAGFTITGFDEWSNAGIRTDQSEYVTVTNNSFSAGGGIWLYETKNSTITDNSLGGRGSIYLDHSWNNRVEGNELNVLYPGQILVMGNSRNNRIIDNQIIGDPNDASCTGIRSFNASNNLYLNNVTSGFRVHLLFSYSDNNIIANNDMSGNRGSTNENGGGIVMYHGNDNILINNTIEDVIDSGITLFGASSDNTIQGNQVTSSEGGIELYYQSNNNLLVNNKVILSGSGIVLDGTRGNTIYQNNLLNNSRQVYDNGSNNWSHAGIGNYYSDYSGTDGNGDGIGDSPYLISTSGVDPYPLMGQIPVAMVTVPPLIIVPDVALVGHSSINVTGYQVWQDETVDLYQNVIVKNGGHLKLDNITLINRTSEDIANLPPWAITVEPGGTLEILNSELFAHGMYIEAYGSLRIENSALFGFGNWDVGGLRLYSDGAVIKNSVIDDSFAAINIIDGSSNHTITGNRISEAMTGVNGCCSAASTGNLIQDNEFSNIIHEALSLSGFSDSIITSNTFEDIGDNVIILNAAGSAFPSQGNLIYENSFYNYGAPPWLISFPDWATHNLWFSGHRGNYWDDFLERYPTAQEHTQYPGIWDTPYEIVTEDDVDEADPYPLMIDDLEPLLWSREAQEITPIGATLQAYFAVRGQDSVYLSFQYRRISDPTWKNTPLSHYFGSGDHTAMLTDLLPNTNYEFRARLTAGDIDVLGETRQFRTEDTLAYFVGTPTIGIMPLTVTFKATTGSPATYQWDFGDGNTSSLKNPVHTYTEVGSYTVTLSVTQGIESDTLTRSNYIHVWKNMLYLPIIQNNE